MGKWCLFEEFNLQKNCGINSAHQNVFGASWNDVWLVYASFSLPEWQAVKMTLLASRFLIPPQPLFMDARHEIFIQLVPGFSKDIPFPPKISEVLSFRFQGRSKTFTWNFTLILCSSFYLLHFSTTCELWTLKASLQ